MKTPSEQRPFLTTLRTLEARLALPLPHRTRLLRELEFDLEEFRHTLVLGGVDAVEAGDRAIQTLVPEGGALAALEAMYQPAYRRWTGRWSDRRVRMLERSGFTLAVTLLLLVGAGALARADLFGDPSTFLLPVLALGAAAHALALWKGFELWVRADHQRPERGLGALLGLCILVLFTGIGGALLDAWMLAARIEADPASAELLAIRAFSRTAGLLATTFVLALSAGLAWFLLRHWVALAAGAHRDTLGHHSSPSRTGVMS